jgi:hypothetical protein
VRRSAQAIHFLDKSNDLYSDHYLELWGRKFDYIEVQIDQRYNLCRVARIKADPSGCSKARKAELEKSVGKLKQTLEIYKEKIKEMLR